MKIWQISKVIRKNEQLTYALEQKYAALIDRVPINYDPKEKFADLIKQCCEEYAKSAKGASNLGALNELLRKLYIRIFLKFKDQTQFAK